LADLLRSLRRWVCYGSCSILAIASAGKLYLATNSKLTSISIKECNHEINELIKEVAIWSADVGELYLSTALEAFETGFKASEKHVAVNLVTYENGDGDGFVAVLTADAWEKACADIKVGID